MLLTEPGLKEKDYLLDVARQAIEHRFLDKKYTAVLPEEYSHLKEKAATFVTLKSKSGALRGCIGTLQAIEPLYLSVSHNAVAAAFSDPRFPPLRSSEWSNQNLSISILSAASALDVSSEQNLKQQLRAGIDGLILKEQGRSATFLPSVWEDLPDKEDFIRQLKMKAGLSADYWTQSIQFSRYQSFSFSGPAIKKHTK